MDRLPKRLLTKIIENKSILIIFVIVFVVYIFSSFDVCWFFGGENGIGIDSGFVFGSSWNEHLHSSEGWIIYYQTQSLYEGRVWLTQGEPPAIGVDFFSIGEYYYAPFEPLIAIMLVPFYTLGNFFLGAQYLIRSVILGMIFYTSLDAILIRKISLQLKQSKFTANLAAFVFAFATMAFSYSRLLYPQPIFMMMALTTLFFLFNYTKNKNLLNLFLLSLFLGLTINTFHTFIIATPFILYYLLKTGSFVNKKNLLTVIIGLMPGIIMFMSWNFLTTGNPLMTARQVDYPSMSFEVVYQNLGGVWLNVEGLVGSLVSPVGIFFVSPILLAAFSGFSSLNHKVKNKSALLVFLIAIFWIFISFANLGGVLNRDFWLGGWANIARYTYFSSTLLVFFAAEGIEKIIKSKNLLFAWITPIALLLSILANFSYGIRHDFMVSFLKDFPSTSLIIWPYPLESMQISGFLIIAVSLSAIYPIYLMLNRIRLNRKISEYF